MSLFVNRISSFAAVATLMCAAAASASAQQAQFHLPFQAKWAGIVMPPGEYRVSLPERSLGRSTFLVHGPTGSNFVMPMTADILRSEPAKPYLQLVNVDGEYFVKKYEGGAGNLTFFFATPKPSHKVQITAQDFINIPLLGD